MTLTSCRSIFLKFGTPIRHIVVYLSIKLGDVLAAFEGTMNDHSAKYPSKSLLIPTA